MIQRIQSLLLGLVAILHGLIFFLPVFVWVGYHSPDGQSIDTKTITALYNYPFIALNSIIILFSLFTVFQYKKRKKQRTFVFVLMTIIILNICLYLYYMFSLSVSNEYTFLPAKSFGMFGQLVSLILCLWAARRIRKDEELVKSVDRIR